MKDYAVDRLRRNMSTNHSDEIIKAKSYIRDLSDQLNKKVESIPTFQLSEIEYDLELILKDYDVKSSQNKINTEKLIEIKKITERSFNGQINKDNIFEHFFAIVELVKDIK